MLHLSKILEEWRIPHKLKVHGTLFWLPATLPSFHLFWMEVFGAQGSSKHLWHYLVANGIHRREGEKYIISCSSPAHSEAGAKRSGQKRGCAAEDVSRTLQPALLQRKCGPVLWQRHTGSGCPLVGEMPGTGAAQQLEPLWEVVFISKSPIGRRRNPQTQKA